MANKCIPYHLIDGTYTKDPTGFVYNNDIAISYNATTRKVTVTGSNLTALYRGKRVKALYNKTSYESVAHDNVDGTYYLYHNGTDFVFSTTPWDFSMLQIALVQVNSAGNYKIALRECHGLMPYQTHDKFHNTVGSVLKSGGDISSYVQDSTVEADRRPNISSSVISDEDLDTAIASLTSKAYTLRYISGSSTQNIKSYTLNSPEIVSVTGNRPNYNQIVNGNWTSTEFPNNAYGKVFVVGIPTTSDSDSSTYRYLFVQPQTVSTDLLTIQNVSPGSLVHGDIGMLLSEFVFIGEIIIRYANSNWNIISASKLTGGKLQQISTAGQYLSIVSTDSTLLGNGTPASPLGVDQINGAKVIYDGTYFLAGSISAVVDECYETVNTERSYTTSEVNTGTKWVDGKDIYKKTVQFTTRSSAGGLNIAHGVTDIDDVVDYFLYIKLTGTGVTKENYISTGYNVSCNVKFDGNFYYSITSTDSSYYSKPAYITIYYTKTT